MSIERKLDVLIAKKVMGYNVKDYRKTARQPFFLWCGEYTNIMWAPNNEPYIVVDDIGKAGCPQVDRIPEYSTSIADAWEIVEYLSKRSDPHGEQWSIHISKGASYKFTCQFCKGCVCHSKEVSAKTAPLAICLAALKAIKEV